MNLKQVKTFKERYETFLRKSNVNLGRTTQKKEAFIAEAMKIVIDFVFAASESDEPEQTESTKKDESKPNASGSDSILSMKPTKEVSRLVDSKGVATMTGPESKRADEELGRSPNVD